MGKAVKPRRRYRSPHRRRQAEATRRQIVDSARRLFADRGYMATTIQNIAAEAGVAVETLYAVFGSKRFILWAVAQSAIAQAQVPLLYGEALAEAGPRQQLPLVAKSIRQLWERGTDLIQIMRRAGMSEPDVASAWREGENARLKRQALIIRALARKRALRPALGLTEAAAVLWALTGPDMYRLLVIERGWSPDRFERWLGDHLVRTLLA